MFRSGWPLIGTLHNFYDRHKTFRELKLRQQEDLLYVLQDETSPLNRTLQALQAGDLQEALRFWRLASARYAALVMTWDKSVSVMSRLGLFDEAEAIMSEGRARHPYDPQYAERLGQIAQNRGDLPLAAARWGELRKKYPGRSLAFSEGAAVYRERGNLAEAEKIAIEAVRAFPESLRCRLEWARAADSREDWPEALLRWEWMNANLPHIVAVLGAARALERLDKIREAKERLKVAKASYPGDNDLRQAIARMESVFPAC